MDTTWYRLMQHQQRLKRESVSRNYLHLLNNLPFADIMMAQVDQKGKPPLQRKIIYVYVQFYHLTSKLHVVQPTYAVMS